MVCYHVDLSVTKLNAQCHHFHFVNHGIFDTSAPTDSPLYYPCSTIWYELHAREWPYKNQPAEVIIWQVGSGMKPNLTQIGMGKEISVSVAHLQQTVPHLLTILNLTFI